MERLLLDDWNLFCENLGKLAEELAGKMINSPLRLEDEMKMILRKRNRNITYKESKFWEIFKGVLKWKDENKM